MPVEVLDGSWRRGERSSCAATPTADAAPAGPPSVSAEERELGARAALVAGGRCTIELDGSRRVVFCHGSPRSDDEILTRITPDEVVDEACGGAQIVVCGHTHVQYDRSRRRSRVVNAGSVGMPYEGRTGAYWALLGPDVELVSTDYDVEAAVAALGRPATRDAEACVAVAARAAHAEEATAVFEARRGA